MTMFSMKVVKTAIYGALGLSMLVGATAQALWTQYLPETEIITQFHGNPEKAQLRLFMAGNQFVVMDNLIAEFKKRYPVYEDIYYVTIPPGKELQWILQEGAEWKAADFPKIQELIKFSGDIRHLKGNINLVQILGLEGGIVHCRTQAVGDRISHNAVNFSCAVNLHQFLPH